MTRDSDANITAVLNYRLSLRRDMQTTQHRSTDALVRIPSVLTNTHGQY